MRKREKLDSIHADLRKVWWSVWLLGGVNLMMTPILLVGLWS